MNTKEQAGHKTVFTLEKREGDINACKTLKERLAFLTKKPIEVIKGEGNCLLTTGLGQVHRLILGDGGSVFDSINSQIGVGNSSTAAAPSQQDLLGASKAYKGMDGGYPLRELGSMYWQASFGAAEGNFTWNEWVIKNTASTVCLNRKVAALGTKSGGTWTLKVGITIT